MIRPTKYMDLNSSVLSVASTILTELQRRPAVSLDELHETILARMGEAASFNFPPALSLLYATGSIDYDENADAIRSSLGRSSRRRELVK